MSNTEFEAHPFVSFLATWLEQSYLRWQIRETTIRQFSSVLHGHVQGIC